MSALAIVRFWTPARLSYVFLEEERARLQQQWQRPVSIGELRGQVHLGTRSIWKHCRICGKYSPWEKSWGNLELAARTRNLLGQAYFSLSKRDFVQFGEGLEA